MSAIDALNANLTQLQADIQLLLAKPVGVPPAQVQAAADAIATLDAQIKQALAQ